MRSFVSRLTRRLTQDLYKSQSFTGYSRSSSYQKYFENDDEVLKPDDNFATDDWDE